MGWVKLDDGFPMHPKVIQLSLEGRWAYIESLCYAARYETDGVVPSVVAANGSVRAELMASGLWESGTASTIEIHDYLVYNPSRTEKERKRNGSRNVRASREGDGVTSPEPSFRFEEKDFAAFWANYPRKVGKPKARPVFRDAVQGGVDPAAIIAGAEHYRDDPNREDEFTAHPTTWLNRAGWDDPSLPQRGQSSNSILDRRLRGLARKGGDGGDLTTSRGMGDQAPRPLSGIQP